MAAELGAEGILFVAHIGKFVKVAGGIIYYAFTILLTVMLIREMAGKSSDNKENESGNK